MIEFVNAEIQYDQSRIFRRLRIEPDTYVYEYSNVPLTNSIRVFPFLTTARCTHSFKVLAPDG